MVSVGDGGRETGPWVLVPPIRQPTAVPRLTVRVWRWRADYVGVGEFRFNARLVQEKAAPYCVRWVRRCLTHPASGEPLADQVGGSARAWKATAGARIGRYAKASGCCGSPCRPCASCFVGPEAPGRSEDRRDDRTQLCVRGSLFGAPKAQSPWPIADGPAYPSAAGASCVATGSSRSPASPSRPS